MLRMRACPAGDRAIAFGLAALLTLGCAEGPVYDPSASISPVTVPAERLVQLPLLPRLPIKAGIHYPPEWRFAELTGWASADPRLRFKLGAAAVALFDQIAAALFAHVQTLPSWPADEAGAHGADIVVVPRIEQSDVAFVSFTLSVEAFAADGSRIAGVETKLWYTPESDPRDSRPGADSARIAQTRLKEALATLSTRLILSDDMVQWARIRGLAWRWPEGEQGAAADIKPSGVAIVQRRTERGFGASVESVALEKALEKLDPQLQIVQAIRLVDALYPWLSSADLDDAVLVEQLRHPATIDRATRSGIRYIVLARTLESRSEEHGGVVPLGGPGGAAFFGLMWWSRHEAGDLHVLDLLAAGEARGVSHRRDVPTFALPAFILPVPIPLSTGEAMAEAIAKQLLPIIRPAP